MAFARFTVIPALLLVVAACSAAAEQPETSTSPIVRIANEGGAREGHTPTSFAGMGTGLFAGDNLNPSFPDGVGVQTYLTFVIPDGLEIQEAHLVSDALQTSGAPFEDLGPLLVEPVAYRTFGPELFDLEATGPISECSVQDETQVRCDVTEALQLTTGPGGTEAQFRIRFTDAADGDGSQDLAMFFRADSNTNEPGLFELVVTPPQADG